MSFKINYVKLAQREQAGDINNLFNDKVKKQIPDITLKEFINSLSLVFSSMKHEKRKLVFQDYYLYKKSIVWIKWNYGFNDYNRVEKMIETAENEVIKIIKENR